MEKRGGKKISVSSLSEEIRTSSENEGRVVVSQILGYRVFQAKVMQNGRAYFGPPRIKKIHAEEVDWKELASTLAASTVAGEGIIGIGDLYSDYLDKKRALFEPDQWDRLKANAMLDGDAMKRTGKTVLNVYVVLITCSYSGGSGLTLSYFRVLYVIAVEILQTGINISQLVS